MTHYHPRNDLSTHQVTNVPGDPGEANLYTDDAMLRANVVKSGAQEHEVHLSDFGGLVGARKMHLAGVSANKNPPVFTPFDAYGRRIDEVEFHPSYHQLMKLGLEHGVSSRAWTHQQGGHVAHCALLFMMSQADSGVTCPMSMTYAAIPALRTDDALSSVWHQPLTSAQYDHRHLPLHQKSGATMGMAMTEKQGGSDVRANTTKAHRVSDDEYRLVGHKWFCSAPMSDGFLTLAQTADGLSCFLVPRWQPDDTRNTIEIQRLKDKLGDRANASAEIEFHSAYAQPLGALQKGLTTIIEMVNHTRLDCAVGATSLMRQSLSLATYHAQHRSAFKRSLIEQPLMKRVIADLALEVEGHMALVFFLAETFDHAQHDQQAAVLARCLTPIVKYWATKRCPVVVVEAMECLGGAGYIEEHVMPRLFRQSPLNGIWEGSGNVIALDVLRALQKSAANVGSLVSLLSLFKHREPSFTNYCDSLITSLNDSASLQPENARDLVERLAKAFTVCALFHRELDDAAVAVLRSRLLNTSDSFGAHDIAIDERSMIERAAVLRARS